MKLTELHYKFELHCEIHEHVVLAWGSLIRHATKMPCHFEMFVKFNPRLIKMIKQNLSRDAIGIRSTWNTIYQIH